MQRIAIDGTFNFREPAGYAAAGGRIRAGALYRSDGLSRLGDSGRSQLAALQVHHIIDLREPSEAESMPDDVLGLGIKQVALPIDTRHAIPPGASATERLASIYQSMFERDGSTLVEAMRLIAAAPRATLVHCTAGKDRTGAVVALALSAAGVDREQILDDYAVSQRYLEGEWLEHMMVVMASYGWPDTPDLRVIMAGSPREVFAQALAELDRSHGHPVEYLRANGLSDDELDALRDRLVEAR